MGASASPPLELRVEVRTVLPGTVRFEAPIDHCLSIHASEPVRASCRKAPTCSLITRGEINLLPVGAFDEYMQEDPSSVVDLHLPGALIRTAAEGLGLDPERAVLEPRSCFRDPQIEHIAWALEAEHRIGWRTNVLYRESLGLALATHLLARYATSTALRQSARLSARQEARVIEWIEAHLDGDVSLARLARVAGVSEPHFRVLFKRSTSVPVHEYVVRRRVERARVLLLRGQLPASQVALEAGFSHQSHMARCMRRVLGVTPSQLVRSRN